MKRDPATTSRIMASVRSRNTEPEVRLRKALRALGLRFRSHPKNVPGHPDFIFPSKKVAVFVDGDFWHGRQWRLRGLSSLEQQFSQSKNRSYWIRKIMNTVRRDIRTTRLLRRAGWHVVRIWESDLKANPQRPVLRVTKTLDRAS